ncbi:phage major capsid protein [Faecalibacterium prausnitzii]|uniref:phage major capsid protein n=1 Tax=Faecalibacterium prausnitzii TaxID=853 RepID=UPI003C2C3645
MVNFDYDCSGWATKANTKCYDGLTIAEDAFKGCSGQTVPMVYNHDHSSLDNVIGHALLENRKGGVYAYAKFNDTPTGQTAKKCVENGDLNAFSIWANGLQKAGQVVKHGVIRELSLVLAGCNPGALIQEVVKHSADNMDDEGCEAFIFNDPGSLSLEHGMDPEGNPLEEAVLAHSDDNKEDGKMAEETNGKTLEEVYNSMTDEQKECCHALVGLALEEQDGDGGEDEEDESGMKNNVFDKDAGKQTVLKHSIDDINSIIKGAKTSGTLKAAFDNAGVEQGEIDELSHGIDNIDWLFPEDHLLDTTPRIIDKPDDWVSVVMGGVKHIPFSRFKSMFADLTPEDARAKGYVKGNYKIEEVFGLLRRSTGPTTVYKKQKLDRDDVNDITSFDVVSWLRNEMRYKLNRELALAYILGDGRQAASEDKIDENCIRPIFNDADLFTIKVQVATTGLSKVEDKYKAFIKQVIRSRKEYRGSGTPAMFTTEDALTEMLLLEDGMGRPLYADEAALARKLRVSKIVTVPEMDGRKGAKGGDLAAVIVNLSDYTVGADKGGAVSMFDDFDIDYNAMKYLIETRCSGALTTPYSAMAIEWAA